jgi:hypothetical protein
MNVKIEFKVTEKALVYAVAAMPVVPAKMSLDDCMKSVERMFEQFGVAWTEHISSHQTYNLKPAWDLVRTLIPLNANSIDELE